jgi:hypothetical protein
MVAPGRRCSAGEPSESGQVVLAGPVAPQPTEVGRGRELERLGAGRTVLRRRPIRAAQAWSRGGRESSERRVPGGFGDLGFSFGGGGDLLLLVWEENENYAPVGPNVGANIFRAAPSA